MLGQLVVPCALPPHTRSWLRKKRTWIQNPFSNPKKVGVAFSGLFVVENINPGPELYLYSSSAFWFPLLSASVPSPARCQYETQGLIGATFIDAHIQPPKTKRIAMQLFNRFFCRFGPPDVIKSRQWNSHVDATLEVVRTGAEGTGGWWDTCAKLTP